MKKFKRICAVALVAVSLTVAVGSSVSAGSWEFCSSCGKYIGNRPHYCEGMR